MLKRMLPIKSGMRGSGDMSNLVLAMPCWPQDAFKFMPASLFVVQGGKVVYFRARQGGACTYFDDRRDGPLPHGLCWASLCKDLQVVDVPGDHFSLLRQDEKDMSIIVDALQMVLSAFGWHTTIKRDQKIYSMDDVSCSRWIIQ